MAARRNLCKGQKTACAVAALDLKHMA